ncbi:CynX/NimT family MFS transporter [Paenibacillus sp. CMAA1364]
MQSQQSQVKRNSLYLVLLITGIVLVAFNLRPAITSVGPLVGIIQNDIGLAHWSAGLLMSIPLVSFAVMSPLVPRIATRLSNEKTLLIGLIILLVGICIRSISMTVFLFSGTLLVGAGIAIGNVLLPVIVKEKFPQRFGLMTSVYSTSMGLFASLASGISIPLAMDLNMGWQGALIVWGIPVVIGILVWVLILRINPSNNKEVKSVSISATRIWHSPLAWKIALFMGFQSSLFYITMSWLPEIIYNNGISRGTAGWLLSLTQIVGLPASFFVPIIAARLRSQVWIACALGMCSIAGYGGLWLSSSYTTMIVSIILIGIALGGNFPLALSYIGIRTRNGQQAAELSGMAQSTGYVIAAVGPILIGYLYDIAHVWTVPLITLMIISILVMIFGMLSGRDEQV